MVGEGGGLSSPARPDTRTPDRLWAGGTRLAATAGARRSYAAEVDGGWTDPRRGYRGRSREVPYRRGDRRVPAAQGGRRRLAQGPVPVPRREDPLVQRHSRPRPVLLPRLRRGRRRDQVRAEDRWAQLRRGGRAAGRPGWDLAALRTGRVCPRAGAEPAPQAD